MKKDKIKYCIIFILINILTPILSFSDTLLPEEKKTANLNISGVKQYYKGNFISAKNYFSDGIKNVSEHIDPITSAILINNIICVDMKESSETSKSQEDILKITYTNLKVFNKQIHAFVVLNNIAITEMRNGNYKSAIEKLEKVIRFFQINLRDHQQGIALNNLSICYRKVKDFNKAIISVNNALNIFENESYNTGLANAYFNKGMIYFEQNKPEIALNYFDIALKYDKKLGDAFNISKTNKSLKECREKIKINKDMK